MISPFSRAVLMQLQDVRAVVIVAVVVASCKLPLCQWLQVVARSLRQFVADTADEEKEGLAQTSNKNKTNSNSWQWKRIKTN